MPEMASKGTAGSPCRHRTRSDGAGEACSSDEVGALMDPDYVPPQEARSPVAAGCLPVGAVALLALVLLIVASVRSCSSDNDVVEPRPGPNLELQACMKERGWVGSVQGQRLRFELGDRNEADFERALQECDELAGG